MNEAHKPKPESEIKKSEGSDNGDENGNEKNNSEKKKDPVNIKNVKKLIEKFEDK